MENCIAKLLCSITLPTLNNILTKRQPMMKTSLLYIFLLFGTMYFSPNAISAEQKGQSNSTPIVKGQEITLFSKVLDEQRTLQISLPINYSKDTTKQYPVLITFDGDSQFHHVSGTVAWLSQQTTKIPEMIVVAINNTNRGRDMTAKHNGGGADNFLKFLETELLPFIDTQYRTQPYRVLFGHSMAGYTALNIMNQAPELFGGVIAASPYFYQDNETLTLATELAKKLKASDRPPISLFLSIGDEPGLMPGFESYLDSLEVNASQSMRWSHLVSADDGHMSIVSSTLNKALKFVFAPTDIMPKSDLASQGVEAIKAHYKDISSNTYGFEISPEVAITRLGLHAYFREKDEEKSLSILKQNTEDFPQSGDAYNALANIYERIKQYNLALEASNKAVAIASASGSDELRWYKMRQQRIEKALKAEAPN